MPCLHCVNPILMHIAKVLRCLEAKQHLMMAPWAFLSHLLWHILYNHIIWCSFIYLLPENSGPLISGPPSWHPSSPPLAWARALIVQEVVHILHLEKQWVNALGGCNHDRVEVALILLFFQGKARTSGWCLDLSLQGILWNTTEAVSWQSEVLII